MKLVIQRVKHANVTVKEQIVGQIGKGLVVLIGIHEKDTKDIADYLINKLISLRVFEDENQKMNISLQEVEGELLLISQFTLYGDCTKGNRPSFVEAAKPEVAQPLYDYIVEELKRRVKVVETGIFGADMQVSLVNDGPVTILLEK